MSLEAALHNGRVTTAGLLLILALVAGAPPLARAQTPTNRAVVLFREAQVHFNLGQYELAADKYLAAIRADPNLPGLYRNLGLAYRAMGKCDLAIAYFRKYLSMSPDGKHGERVRKEIAECAKKTGSDPNANIPVGAAQIVLRVKQNGAQIRIDDVMRGSTPTDALSAPPGRHVIVIYLSGYLPWSKTLDLTEGEVVAVEVTLTPDPSVQRRPDQQSQQEGVLKVTGLPRSGWVMVDDVTMPLNARSEIRLAPGSHRVSVHRSGMASWEQVVVIRSGATTVIAPTLVPTARSRTLRRWAWGMVGTAAALGLAGVVLGLMENRSFEELRDYSRKTGTRAELDERVSTLRTQGLVANILYGAALACLGTGVILFTVTPEPDPARPRSRGVLFRGQVAF